MSVTIDSSSAVQALKRLGANYKKAEAKAINEASDFVKKELVKNTPRYTGLKNTGKRGKYMLEHAEDHIVNSKAKNGKSEVGFDDDVAWRVHFIEFGTINQRPQAFVQRTQRDVQIQVIEIMTNVLRKELMK